MNLVLLDTLWIAKNITNNGLLLIEARSDKDPMLLQGDKISKNENITDHYRRYLNYEITIKQIESLGFTIIESCEQDNLSIVGKDNPVLIRIIGKLNKNRT